MAQESIDRLVRKEVSLGVVREKLLPDGHIGLATIAPFLDVATDDVIFDYIRGGFQDGLAPARAEDAEAELGQKDDILMGQGRANVTDWAFADKYSASDVTRYRESLYVNQQLSGLNTDQPLNFLGRTQEDFEARLARHDARRRRYLDNRIEWLIMTGVFAGVISYNDGKIKWTVNYGRPANQTAQAPAGALWDAGTTHDPIGDFLVVDDAMYQLYGVHMNRAIMSKRAFQSMWKSTRFIAAAGLVVGGTPSSTLDLRYISPTWGPQAAAEIVEQATNITIQIYDSIYRTRAIGSTQSQNIRFTDERDVLFLPGDLGEIDDTEIGFAKTLTSPHPEGNWSSGYYEWEESSVNPWQHVRGSGIKAFPVYLYLEYTYTMRVLGTGVAAGSAQSPFGPEHPVP